MEEAIVQLGLQVPTVALTLLFTAWVIRLVFNLLLPRIDRLIDLVGQVVTLMDEHVRRHA